ncbi:hypothetical protein [Longitalea arenae]|uniref:hypothetical protein n=1 Tax=Longitalea arenae TaxID=2812558 RepID=UPI0019681B95|nr:hypothetical protein [Longitalea arenae]
MQSLVYICNNVVNTELTLFAKYRYGVTLFLLLLYGFIAVPVQFWHYHPDRAAQNKRSFHSTVSKDLVGKIHDCKICSHAYSVFAHDHAAIEIGIAAKPIFLAPAPVLDLLEFAGPAFSNKGPPHYFS